MKKYLFLLLTAIIAVMLSSCNNAQKQLEEGLKVANATCPVNIGSGITITGYFIEDNYVVFSYLCDESQISAESLFNSLDGGTFVQMAAMDENVRTVLDLMTKADVGLKFRVTGSSSGFRDDLAYENNEVKTWQKSLQNGDIDGSVDSYLKVTMDAAKKSCPMQVDEITVMTDCGYEDNAIFYIYSIIEDDEFTIDDIDEEIMEDMLRENLSDEENPAIEQLVGHAKEAGAKFRYTYIGSQTGHTISIVVDSEEL